MSTTATPRDITAQANARDALRHARAALEYARSVERNAQIERMAAIRKARAAGLSYAQIAGVLGITRQAVFLIDG